MNRGGSTFDEYDPVHRQSVLTFRLDDFIKNHDVPFPTHVKIDVDGNDPLVLAGMSGLLGDQRLKHISIEVNPKLREADHAIPEMLASHGFTHLTDARFDNPRALKSNRAYNAYYSRIS